MECSQDTPPLKRDTAAPKYYQEARCLSSTVTLSIVIYGHLEALGNNNDFSSWKLAHLLGETFAMIFLRQAMTALCLFDNGGGCSLTCSA